MSTWASYRESGEDVMQGDFGVYFPETSYPVNTVNTQLIGLERFPPKPSIK